MARILKYAYKARIRIRVCNTDMSLGFLEIRYTILFCAVTFKNSYVKINYALAQTTYTIYMRKED